MYSVGIKERLDAYRRRKRREEMTKTIKNGIQITLPWNNEKTIEDPLLTASPDDVEVRLRYS